MQSAASRCTSYALAEATLVHRRMGFFPARSSEYGDDVRRRLEQGDEVSPEDIVAAAEAKRVIDAAFETALAGVDAILAPTTPIADHRERRQPRHHGWGRRNGSRRPHPPQSPREHCRPAGNHRPLRPHPSGLPIGLQIIAPLFAETRLLRIAQL